MNLKTKLTLAFWTLFAVIVLLGGLGAWYLNELANDTKAILKDNYRSLELVQRMREVADAGQWTDKERRAFEQNLAAQERNITEPGERDATARLRRAFDGLGPDSLTARQAAVALNPPLAGVTALNMAAMLRKNAAAEATAGRVKNYMLFFASLFALLTFSFILNFPAYVADPIRELSEGIRGITEKNYEQRLNFRTGDEFGELATSFNLMAQRLDEYEHSNLAKILFEKRRIEAIVNRMQDAIVGFDERNHVLFINPVASDMLGLTAPDVVGQYAPDVALRNDLLRTLLTEPTSGKPLKIFANDRESYFSKDRFEVTSEQAVIGNVIVLKNITAFYDLDQAKTNFIATISHELKTPISAIKMSLKLLEDQRIGSLNGEQTHLIANVKDDTDRLLHITGELLDLAQVETGNIQLNFQPVRPADIVALATQAIRTQAEQKPVVLVIDAPEALPAVQADPEKTAWVLVNFLSNAVRYSAERGEVTLRAEVRDNTVRFEVKDDGRGIDEKYQSRLFDRYFQVPSSPAFGGQPKGGTGLGLAISKEFIEAQGGIIGVESQPGQGSRFYFTLPAVPTG